MMRLIDKDELKLHKFLKRKPDAKDVITGSDIYMAGWNDAIDAIVDNAPSVDAVEVVRCKNCKYGEIDDKNFPWQYFCHYTGDNWNDENHFCGYGERKEKKR